MRTIVLWILSGILLLSARVQAQKVITPEQAIQAVREFISDPNAEFTVYQLYDDGPVSSFGLYYEVRTKDDLTDYAAYYVGATDGAVRGMFIRNPNAYQMPGEVKTPVLSLPEAQAIAEEFARRHYPPFSRLHWQLVPEKDILGPQGTEYKFAWYPVLNSRFGTLGPWYLEVDVDGISGRVVAYYAPPDRPILAPVVPRISLHQAKAIAAPFARYDLLRVPFGEAQLQVIEDPLGVQWLMWFLYQYPNPVVDPYLHFSAAVDAITGRYCGFSAPIGGSSDPSARPVRSPLRDRAIRLRADSAQGPLVGSVVAPMLERGRVWVRAELLRGFGARVQVERERVEVRVGEKVVSGEQVGAKWRDYGWWVLLRRMAEALGWRVEWRPGVREVIVYSGPQAEQSRLTPVR